MVRYLVEESKTARSSCQECKGKINKGVLRIGKASNNGDHEITKYYHCGCWRVPRTVKKADELEGFADLSSSEQQEVRDQMEKPKESAAAQLLKAIKPGSEGEIFKKEMERLPVPALKEILKLNHQPLDKTKESLVASVVDGMIHGAIPACPLCGDGKLSLQQGGYKCSGSFDASAKRYTRCKFSATNVDRTFWIMPSTYRESLQ